MLHWTLTVVPPSELNVFYFTFNSERSVRIWGIGGGVGFGFGVGWVCGLIRRWLFLSYWMWLVVFTLDSYARTSLRVKRSEGDGCSELGGNRVCRFLRCDPSLGNGKKWGMTEVCCPPVAFRWLSEGGSGGRDSVSPTGKGGFWGFFNKCLSPTGYCFRVVDSSAME